MHACLLLVGWLNENFNLQSLDQKTRSWIQFDVSCMHVRGYRTVSRSESVVLLCTVHVFSDCAPSPENENDDRISLALMSKTFIP